MIASNLYSDHFNTSAGLGLADHMKQRSTIVLLALGVLAVVIHATVRFPLHLPGHHGLEWMALLVLARQMSSYRWAATMTASGAAATSLLPVLGFHDLLTPVTYFAPGVALDLLCLIAPLAWRKSSLFLGIAAALAFATKPVIQWGGAAMLDLPLGALSQGVAYIVALHMMFALAGGWIAAYLWRGTQSRQ